MKNSRDKRCAVSVSFPRRDSSVVMFGDITRDKLVAARHVFLEVENLRENGVAIYDCDNEGMPISEPHMILRGTTVKQLALLYANDADLTLKDLTEADLLGQQPKAPVIELATFNGKTVH